MEEVSSTKNLQRIEQKQKKELYQMLEELMKQNEQLDIAELNNETEASGKPVVKQEELIKQAKIMFNGNSGAIQSKGGSHSSNNEPSSILQRLDKMIRVIKEHDHITAPERDMFGKLHNVYSFQYWRLVSYRFK